MTHKALFLGSIALLSLGYANAASAQATEIPNQSPATVAQTPPQADQDAGAGLADIVVTAEKRPNTAQRTPISLSVLDAATLKENHVQSLVDIATIAPGVSFSSQINGVIVAVRGVSSRDATEIGDPAVSVSIDGFNLQRSTGLNLSVFDLERVEVLRGPQGTLLGRNATGGAINLITAKPTDRFAASVTGEIGNFNTYNTNGFVNLPIADGLNIRAAFQTRDHDGYRNNSPAINADDSHSKAARLSLGFEPTERLSGVLTFEYAKETTNGVAYYSAPVATYTAANVPTGLLVGDIVLNKPAIPDGASSFPLPPGSYLDTRNVNIRGQLNYDLGFGTLTYVGGWRKLDVNRLTDHGGAYGTIRQNYAFRQTEHPESWNHELRLGGDPSKQFFWQVGGFYFLERNNLVSALQDYPNSPGFYGPFVLLQQFVYPRIVAEAKAVFGQVSYEIMPGLKIEGGARYSHDDKSRIGYTYITSPGTYLATRCGVGTNPPCTYTTADQAASASSSKTTFHAGVDYQVTPRNLIYAKFDTGYKAGGFVTITGFGPSTYGPENISAYEVGTKNRFLNNSLQLNLSAFYYDYTNQQVTQATTLPNGVFASTTVNAGRSRYYGIEGDLTFQFTPADRFDLYAAYVNAEYKDFQISVSGLYARIAAAEGRLSNGNWQLAGRTPPQAPRFMTNAGYAHDFSIFGGTLTTRAQTHFETKTYFTFYNNNSDEQKAYTRSDFIVTYTPAGARWSLQGYVRNIENSLILTNAVDASSTTFNTYRYQFQAPRTAGASLTLNF